VKAQLHTLDASGVFMLANIVKGQCAWLGECGDGMCRSCWSSEPLLMRGELPPGRVDNADDYDAIAWTAFGDDFKKPTI